MTFLNLRYKIKLILKRDMHRSRQIAAKNTFYFMERICEASVLDKITKADHSVLLDSILEYCCEPNEGAVQHKYTLTHSIFRGKYLSQEWEKSYQKIYPNSLVSFTPNIPTDFRISGELPVVRHYENAFRNNIKSVILTGDSITTTFEKQKQTNPDMIVHISSSFGLKDIYQDVKSGTNMVKHSSRGSIGIITYDPYQKPIPFTTHDLDLFEINKKRLNNLSETLKEDHMIKVLFENSLKKCYNILYTEPVSVIANTKIQQILWREMQCHPAYKRSIAFTFTENQTTMPYCSKYETYKTKFVSVLGDKTLDPNKIGDRKEIYRAMLLAYREIEPNIAKKLNYFITMSNVAIDENFLHILGGLIKSTLI